MSKDIAIHKLESLPWNDKDVLASLDKSYDYVLKLADELARWYLIHKNPKRLGARLLRIGAILLGSGAAIVPILVGMQTDSGPIPVELASILAALAGTLILLDKLLGCSTGWVRYMDAYFRIDRLVETFQFEWNKKAATLQGAAPDPQQIQDMLTLASETMDGLKKVVEEESRQWATEFMSAVKQIDDAQKAAIDAAKAAESALRDGAINLTVENGDKCKEPWTLTVNGGPPTSHTGTTAAVSPLKPGTYAIKAQGVINGQLRSAEIAVVVVAGQVVGQRTKLS